MKSSNASPRETSAIKETLHLVQRFVGSVRPGAPSHLDVSWVKSILSPAEIELWDRMSNPDKRHAVAVGRAVEVTLVEQATKPVLVAALLHDVGKIQSAYRTPARCVATVVWAVVPTSRAESWAIGGWPLRRLGQYRRHPEIGEGLLLAAGSDVLPVTWAGDHHRPASKWRVDESIGHILKDCDDD